LRRHATKQRVLLGKLQLRLRNAQFNLGKPSIAAVDGSARRVSMTPAISCSSIVAARAASSGYTSV